jgi:hypothetical protein
LEGTDWGTAGFSYSISVTPSGGAPTSVSSLIAYQSGNPASNAMDGFHFQRNFGSTR